MISGDRRRVAVDVTPLVGVRTGIGHAVAEIVEALAALEAAPVVVPYALSRRARDHRSSLPAGTRFPAWPARILLTSWARTDWPRIDRALGRPDVVHATNYLVPPSRRPTVVSVYDCSFVRYPELCSPEVRGYEPVLRRALRRGVTVHTASHFVADEIEEMFGLPLRAQGRLEVIPLGVPDLGPAAPAPDDLATRIGGAPYVLAIGTVEPRKNLPQLVGAFSRVAARQPELRLVLAGPDGAGRPALDTAVAALDAATRARVVLVGPVSDTERRVLLTGATALAYPSIYEGFGFPLLEAMSVGVPVVAARAGSIPEVAGDAALLVEATDEDALAEAIDRLASDDSLRRELVARGRDRVSDFSWSDTARALALLYRSLAP